MRRRSLLVSGLAGAAACAVARPQRPGTTGGALRVGADAALIDSGLARALQQAFSGDTGIGVQMVRGAALPLLDALAAGEFDAGLTNAPEAEAKLDRQGLVHDRRPIATGEFIIVGPGRTASRGAAVAAPARDASAFLSWLNQTAIAQPDALVFLSANDGSGAHIAEQSAWRSAGIAPQAPWYRVAAPNSGLIAQARAKSAFALVERGAWNSQGGAPLAILVQGDRQLVEEVHAMRSFRSPHPAGKIFIAWIAGARGRAVVAAQRGYRAPHV